jgi:hypothetical protein
VSTSPLFVPSAVLLIDVPDADENVTLSWRDLDGFPQEGYRRARVYLRYRGVPFAKLNVTLDDQGFPREPLPGVPPEARRVSRVENLAKGAQPVFPLVTVLVSTAGKRLDLLKRCLKSLTALKYPAYEVVVVDNRPQSQIDKVDQGSEDWAALWIDDVEAAKLMVIREARPGLSFARNTGVAAARGEIIAFTDDDVEVDPNWLQGIVDAFNASPAITCVTGLVIPAELETEAQQLCEIFYGGFDRGLVPRLWRIPDRKSGSGFLRRSSFLVSEIGSSDGQRAKSLYVLAGNCGVGANMAARREFALRCPFDVALGAGSIARSGEDTRFYADVLWAGGEIAYVPSSIVRHTHRREMDALESQVRGVGVGMTALMTSLVVADIRHLAGIMLTEAPSAPFRWARSALSGQSGAESRDQQETYPPSLRRTELVGMMLGPWRYFSSRRRVSSFKSTSTMAVTSTT